ncbi:sugar phosphate isomerase/epimerase family protein [Salibacterium aidingense]|uniref:sugar phosphate isomerase/epimerase family protein n=1 Tax=Salibacterium aidingense TaxID=384933 RepID=UPI0003FABAA9|nr:sugar phosphate isomerase/epimerase family protein [Salibacterium aidingense]
MKVSCHLITWGNELLTGMKEASELGYQACETFTHNALEYEHDVEQFQELLQQHGFQLSALYGGGRFSDPAKRKDIIEENTRVARFLAANGSGYIMFGPKGPRTEGGTTTEELKIAAETINEAAKACADLGVKACVHPHLGTEIELEHELDAVMEHTDPDYVYFCPDTAHLAKAGMDPLAIVKRYRDRIGYVHLKDISPEHVDAESFPILSGNEAMPIFCELGLGILPDSIREVTEYLKETSYNGWMTVEIDKSTSTPYQSLKTCRDFVENQLHLSL